MSSSNEKVSVEDGTDDALEKFNELFGDLGDINMGATEPPQANEKGSCPQLENEEDPYSYNPFDRTQLPQTEGEVKSAIEDLTQKLRTAGLTRRNLLNRAFKEHPEQWKALRRPASMHANKPTIARPNVDLRTTS
jgi:hypothetical protein